MRDGKPLRISLVVPNFNSGPLLERALRSILDQNYPDLQIIVADSCSDDESASVLSAFEPRLNVVLRERDSGQPDGLNRGFRHADGQIFGWLCADDELLPGTVHHVAALFAGHPEAGVVAGASERVFGDRFTSPAPVRGDAWNVVMLRNPLDQPSVFWRSEWHRRAGELDTSFHLAFDWEFWCRLKRSGARLLITDRLLSRYHFSRSNKTSVGGSRHVEEGYRIIREYGGTIAGVYRFLYDHFDLHGCMDDPPSAGGVRMLAYRAVRELAHLLYGQAAGEYNWHFASLQQRGLDWWDGEEKLLARNGDSWISRSSR